MAAAPMAQKQRTTSARAAFPGGHGKALTFCPGRQGAQQGGGGGHHGDVGRQRTP